MKERELETLILDLFEQEISELDFARLEEELALDPEARETFRDFAYIQSQLEARQGSRARRLIDNPLHELQRRTLRISIGIAAAIVGLLALGLHFTRLSRTHGDLTFRIAPDSAFLITSTSGEQVIKEGTLPVGCSMELSQGTAELGFESGVRAIVTAPASLTLSAADRIELHEGKAWFHVPEEGRGFQVRTAGLMITDHGTEFGVIKVPGSTDELHIFDGEVHVRALSGLKKEQTLHRGDSVRAGVRGDLQPPATLKVPFVKTLPDALPFLHFPFDRTDGDRTRTRGAHPALAELTTHLIQSDGRPASNRLTKGRFGKALSFDGLGDIVQTNWSGVFGAQPVTVAFWIKPEGRQNYAGIVSWGAGKSETAINQQWKLVLKEGMPSDPGRVFRCSWGLDGSTGTPVDLPAGEWSHLAVVYTGEASGRTPAIRFYVNGERREPRTERIPSPPRRPSDLSHALPLTFGHPLDWPEGTPEYERNFLRGGLDEIFIIEGALSDVQINRIFRENVYAP